ncbi:lipocalin-15-like [Eublepharis macularius]|uniref:Lipocalin-15-like n=1 Tax=Eublepharis macularius TaxID=481883 RepID=A0AA97LGD3_EUBMA|nr:lipocalin-15-like [Eublepharis macularius]
MKITLSSLMMVLLWAVCAQADVVVQPDFDLQKFAGTWQVLGGSSNCPVFQSMKDIMKTSAAIVTPLPDGDMKILTGYPMPEECKKVERVFKKTEQPGHFTHADDVAKRDVRVMETDYTSFAFLYTFKEAEGEPSTTTLQFYSRGSDASPEVVEKFKQHCHDVGLTDDLMVMLPKSDECLKALSA